MDRRDFLRRFAGAGSAGVGLGWLAASCAMAPNRNDVAAPGSGQEKDMPTAVAKLRAAFKVRPGCSTPLPNVYASSALEVVYLIQCGKRSVLVDTGFAQNFKAHLQNFETAGVDLRTIDALFTTHFHIDHTGGLGKVQELLGCPIVAHRNNVEVMAGKNMAATAAEMPYIPGWIFEYQPVAVDVVVEDGDTVKVGDVTFTVVHLPGHTPGCTGYLWEGKLVTGDVVFHGGRLGWNDVHWGSNYHDVLDTMERLQRLKPDTLLPSHGAPFAFDDTISEGGRKIADGILTERLDGPMRSTSRAPRAEDGRTPRKISL